MSTLRESIVVEAADLTAGTILTDGEFCRIEVIEDLYITDEGVHFSTNASIAFNAGYYCYPKHRRVAIRAPR